MLSRRSILLGSLATAASLAVTGRARASVSVALTLSELVGQSRHALVGTPVDRFSQWETIGRARRIVTYTLVRADYSLDGRPPSTGELMVRTLGGIAGDVGQVVPGEAVLHQGAAAAVFLSEIGKDLFAVTGMAQGHYPLTTDGVRRLRATATEVLHVAADSAVKLLDGRTVPEVETLIFSELSRGAR
jgi:hypothetical protein